MKVIPLLLALTLLSGCLSVPDSIKPYVDKVTSFVDSVEVDKPTDFDPFGEK